MTKRDKTTVDDIIGIVHTDETTNSVEEVKKLRGRTNERFKLDSEIGFIDTQKCGGNTMTLFEVVVELNKLNEENEQLKENCKNYNWYKQYKTLLKENEQLKQELFESEKEWYECHYADNPVRLDSKLEELKEEFKERFGRDFE